jgi:superfamily II DNA or RNA helicase
VGEVWAGPEDALGEFVTSESEACLRSYKERPELVGQDANIEKTTVEGGYGRKQLNELVQNAADAMDGLEGRISIVLTKDYLYCANEGMALGKDAVRTLLLSHSSAKRDDKIGRFGLGFKSVLQVSDAPEIISRTGSFRWSKDWARDLICRTVPDALHYPVLRIAKPFDPMPEARADATLSSLMEWATTVVRLPLKTNVNWLDDEMKAFPPQFLLFSDQIGSLYLDNQTKALSTQWTATRNGNCVVLSDGTSSDEWRVFSATHVVSPQAAADAGSIVARERVEIVWAVPMTGTARRNLGSFWNYFPTDAQTSLRGIINASFKMNEDRHNMLTSLYNEEILTTTFPRMVADAMADLVDPEDPGSIFDLLPSRGREPRSWADEIVNLPVMKAVAATACIPDRSGRLRRVDEINVQPQLEDATRIEEAWDQSVGNHRPWVHSSAFSRERNPQLTRLLELNQKKRASITRWLEEVVEPRTLDSFETALQIATTINKSHPELHEDMRRSCIVLAADGTVQPPITTKLFIPQSPDDSESRFVAYALVQQGRVAEYLRALDFQALDAIGQVLRVARAVAENYDDIDAAESLWRLSRSVQTSEMLALLTQRTAPMRIKVKCKDAKWRPLAFVWLSGAFVAADSVGDESIVVDDVFHRLDVALLRALGGRSALGERKMIRSGGTYDAWKSAEANRLARQSERGVVAVSPLNLQFPQALCTDGLEYLMHASPKTRAKVTTALLQLQHFPAKIEYSNIYKDPEVIEGPESWWIRNFGVLATPLGLVETKYCVGDVKTIPRDFLPFPGEIAAEALSLPTDGASIQWTYALSLAEQRLSIGQTHELYGLLAQLGVRPPKELLVRTKSGIGRCDRDFVRLATDGPTLEYLNQSTEIAAIRTIHSELDDALLQNWKLEQVTVSFRRDFRPEVSGEQQSIGKLHSGIARVVSGVASIPAQACASIRINRSNDHDSVESIQECLSAIEDGVFYYLQSLTPRERLQELFTTKGIGKKASDVLAELRAIQKAKELEAKKRRALSKQTEAERIAELVGVGTIRGLIPDHIFKMIESRSDGELDSERLFSVASKLHGADLIKKLQPALEELGIDTPAQFRGNREALDFVRSLGLSEDFAGQSFKKKPEREEIMGPVRLSPMHDYQRNVSSKVKGLLSDGSTKRAILQLPTGAGKTRVAVESVIDHVAKTPGHHLVIWIAQTEELCEQAVDTWTYVWQAAGPSGERMALSRLWGGNSAEPEETKLHLVVASIQMLASIFDTRRDVYQWLANTDLVIIDEAHGATSPSYTKVLSWFRRSHTDRSNPLLGLSATPYRGSNEAETKRLVNRFGANLLVPDQFDSETAHEYLQGLGVLAKVRHELLEGMELTLKDLRSATNVDEQSSMLEARLDLDEVARDQRRNDNILDHIQRQDVGTAIVFAASVAHAEALAATLTVEGIPAAAISSKTEPAHRRRLIEEFRREEIKVLTNFDVLSQGFDAPKVGAVYVCRPTFSPNKYIQMVGRGLRGPLNGGSEEVLIVNVKDNLDKYGHQLAFTEFDHLWKEEETSAS